VNFGVAEPERVLTGKTLELYVYLLKQRHSLTLAEIHRELGFSTPSLVLHHLEKLILIGVVSKDENGKYVLERKVDVDVLMNFVTIGNRMFPRLALYSCFFLVIAFAYLFLSYGNLNLLAIIGTLGSALVLTYESFRTWKRRPF
jgi:hypothetical protein